MIEPFNWQKAFITRYHSAPPAEQVQAVRTALRIPQIATHTQAQGTHTLTIAGRPAVGLSFAEAVEAWFAAAAPVIRKQAA